jgi:RNA polymerase sigma-B factor
VSTSTLDPFADPATLIETRELLNSGIEQLAPRERLLIHLRFVEELTQSEIASRLGISQMHVSRLLAQSVEQLRSSLGNSQA